MRINKEMMREAKIIDIHDDEIKKVDRDLIELRKIHDDMKEIADDIQMSLESSANHIIN